VPDTIDYDSQIREGLNIVSQSNTAVLLAAMPLDVLDGLSLTGVVTALKEFTIQFDKTHKYQGRMTQEHYDYLTTKEHLASLEALSKAVIRLLAHISLQIRKALLDLNEAWDKPATSLKLATGVAVPTACCVSDGQVLYISQASCNTLKGSWRDPCDAKPPPKPKGDADPGDDR